MEITTSAAGDGGGRPGQRQNPDGQADGGGGRPRLRGAADIADEDVRVRCAQFLQRGDGSGRGAAAAQDDGGGRGRGARMAQRIDDSGDVGVVADQPRGAGVRPAGRALKRHGVHDAEGAGNAADLIHFPDHAGSSAAW